MTRLAVVAALLGLLALPGTASAHALLESSEPSRGAALTRSPERVQLTFDEPVESSFGALRVFDSDGGRVDVEEVSRPSPESVAVAVEPDLPDGPYTATYRVVSADSHPVDGGFVFTVGDVGGARVAAVADLVGAGAGPVTDAGFGVARVATYLATALLMGGAAFLLLAWRPALRRLGPGEPWSEAQSAFEERARTVAVGAGVTGLAATAAGIALQGALAGGTSLWAALDLDVLRAVLDTRFGTVWELRLTAFGALVPMLLWRAPVGPLRGGAIAVALAYLLVSPALSGHAGAGDDAPLLVPLDVVHVGAMSAWVGGVALLALAVPAATRRLEPGDRAPLLAAVVARFSLVALTAVAVLLATGVGQSVVHLAALSDLVDTAFGRALVAKAALLAVLIGFGAHNRLRSGRRLERLAAGQPPGRAGVSLRRALRGELAVMAAALGVTAALVTYSPSSAAGPFSGSAELGPARLELFVDPALAGRNEVHLYLFERATGAQWDRSRGLKVTATEPERDIGPLRLAATRAGPGHYVVRRADLSPTGDWTVAVRARISRFEELRAELEVPIR